MDKVITSKNQDIRIEINLDIKKNEEEMKKVFSLQKSENARLQQLVSQMKIEKTTLQQQLLTMQRRIAELELMVGNEANFPLK